MGKKADYFTDSFQPHKRQFLAGKIILFRAILFRFHENTRVTLCTTTVVVLDYFL